MFRRSGHQVADKPTADPGRGNALNARASRWLRRLWSGLCMAAFLLLMAVALTKRPGDPQLYPPPAGAPAIEVFVVSHGYHAGIVVPRARAAEVAGANRDARLDAVTTRFADYPWLEFGWGDAGFYTSVPTIGSLTLPMALRALFRPGNPSVVHVVGLAQHPRTTFASADIVRLRLSEAGFARLLDRLDATFAEREEGGPEPMGPGLYGPSLFYRGVGAFHLFNVCNHWIANLLDAAGVPTTPLLATLPAGLLYDLKQRAAAEPVTAP
jgi:uncharacterized protein (TIGR02117 family)